MPDNHAMLNAEAERFERRLAEEVSGVRAELQTQMSALRAEMHEYVSELRAEVHAPKLEMHDSLAAVRHEMATIRADTLKWSFLFWIGQVATIAALLSFMLRRAGR